MYYCCNMYLVLSIYISISLSGRGRGPRHQENGGCHGLPHWALTASKIRGPLSTFPAFSFSNFPFSSFQNLGKGPFAAYL